MDCQLRVGVVGLNFKTADLPLREAIARSTVGLTGEAGLFFPHSTVVLSTCNRCEIYFGGSSDLAEVHTHLLQFLRRELNMDFEHRLYSYFGIDCLSHLCRVTAGLDSAIVAETEIQRQVKCAYLNVSKKGLPSGLHFLFQKALRVGKEIRTSLPAIRGGAMVFSAMWDLIRKYGVDLLGSKILFVGNSQMNRELIFFLGKRGMEKAHLSTRYRGREVSEFLDSEGIFGREILSDWDRYDLIFSASKSSDYLLKAKKALSKRRLIFDLSVPRNVDPEIGEDPHTLLFNIEQLDGMASEMSFPQLEILNHCEARVKSHALRLCASYRIKIQHGQGFSERGLHPLCFPSL